MYFQFTLVFLLIVWYHSKADILGFIKMYSVFELVKSVMNKTIFVLMVFVVLMADFNKKRFPHNFYSFTKRVYQQTKVVDKKHNLYANPHIEHSSDTPSTA